MTAEWSWLLRFASGGTTSAMPAQLAPGRGHRAGAKVRAQRDIGLQSQPAVTAAPGAPAPTAASGLVPGEQANRPPPAAGPANPVFPGVYWRRPIQCCGSRCVAAVTTSGRWICRCSPPSASTGADAVAHWRNRLGSSVLGMVVADLAAFPRQPSADPVRVRRLATHRNGHQAHRRAAISVCRLGPATELAERRGSPAMLPAARTKVPRGKDLSRWLVLG